MPWWRPSRSKHAEPAPTQAAERVAAQRSGAPPIIREAERRSLTRLVRRETNLHYDIAQAESSLRPENRWTERMGQLDEAIDQAGADLAALVPESHGEERVTLPATPILVSQVSPRDPAEVVLAIEGTTVRYREEPDWAERGHQLALPQLTLAAGHPAELVPAGLGDELRERLAVHLANGLSIVANEALERAVDGEPPPQVTLAELARPCERCGGWEDVKGRCPACTALDRRRDEIRAARDRLLDEREEVAQDMARMRDRLPVFRRQLAEVEADIAKLRAKGVAPL